MGGDNGLVEKGLDLGDVDSRKYTEGWGKSEKNGTGVNNSLDLKGADETGGEFGRNSLQGKVLCPEPHPLAGGYWGAGRRRLLACNWEREDARRSTARVRFQARWHLRQGRF